MVPFGEYGQIGASPNCIACNPPFSLLANQASGRIISRLLRMSIAWSKLDDRPHRSILVATVDATSIETKGDQLDAHLRSADSLNAEQHPTITFRNRKVERNGNRKKYRLIGDLTIRVVTREVAMYMDFDGAAKDPWGNEASALLDHRRQSALSSGRSLSQATPRRP